MSTKNIRSSSFSHTERRCRVAVRCGDVLPVVYIVDLGFRPVAEVKKKGKKP